QTSASVPTCERASASRISPPALARGLWQVTQYVVRNAGSAAVVAAAATFDERGGRPVTGVVGACAVAPPCVDPGAVAVTSSTASAANEPLVVRIMAAVPEPPRRPSERCPATGLPVAT